MYLRSGRYLGTRVSEVASQAATRGSGTNSQGNLESIREYSSSECQSDTISIAKSDMDINENMHDSTQRKGKSVGNPFDDHSERMEVRVELKYEAINNYNALIYKDPLDRNVYKFSEHNTPFNECPKVVYQGDSYIGEDGSRYVVTSDPINVDSFGVL